MQLVFLDDCALSVAVVVVVVYDGDWKLNIEIHLLHLVSVGIVAVDRAHTYTEPKKFKHLCRNKFTNER